jgi:RNA-binding protein
MELTSKQRSQLRSLAHEREPVVITGQRGLTPAVLAEIETALAHHELIKIRLGSTDRDERERMTQEICEKTASAWVQNIGRIAIIYRPAEKPRIKLDDE